MLVGRHVAKDEARGERGEHGVEVEHRRDRKQRAKKGDDGAQRGLRAAFGVLVQEAREARAHLGRPAAARGDEDAERDEADEHGDVRAEAAAGGEEHRHRHDGQDLAHGAVGLDDLPDARAAQLAVAHDGHEGAVGRGGQRDGERGHARLVEAEPERGRKQQRRAERDRPAQRGVAAHGARELAKVELVAGHEEEQAHAEATHQVKARSGVDDAQAARAENDAGHDEKDDLGNGTARNQARDKRADHDGSRHDGEHTEVGDQKRPPGAWVRTVYTYPKGVPSASVLFNLQVLSRLQQTLYTQAYFPIACERFMPCAAPQPRTKGDVHVRTL